MNKLIVLSICAVLSASCSNEASSSNRDVSQKGLMDRLCKATARVDVKEFFQAIQDGADINRAFVYLDGSADSALQVLVQNSCASDQFKREKPLTDVLVLLDYLVKKDDGRLLSLKLKRQMHGLGLLESVLDQGDFVLGNEYKLANIYARIAARHLELGIKPELSGKLANHYARINNISVPVNSELMTVGELVEKLEAMPEQNGVIAFLRKVFSARSK